MTASGGREQEPPYVIVPVALLVGPTVLSDGAIVTYQVIASHDWREKRLGKRKGFVFPSLSRLAALRRTTARTIQRHIDELKAAGLIVVLARPGKPSLI